MHLARVQLQCSASVRIVRRLIETDGSMVMGMIILHRWAARVAHTWRAMTANANAIASTNANDSAKATTKITPCSRSHKR